MSTPAPHPRSGKTISHFWQSPGGRFQISIHTDEQVPRGHVRMSAVVHWDSGRIVDSLMFPPGPELALLLKAQTYLYELEDPGSEEARVAVDDVARMQRSTRMEVLKGRILPAGMPPRPGDGWSITR